MSATRRATRSEGTSIIVRAIRWMRSVTAPAQRGTGRSTALRAVRMDLASPEFIAALKSADGSNLSRLRNPNSEIKQRARMMRAGGRMLVASDSYARNFVRQLKLNVSGPYGIGRRAEVRVGGTLNKALNDALDDAWTDFWWGRVSADGRLTGIQCEHLFWQTIATDGEVFIRLVQNFPHNPYGLALQFIDADQIDVDFNREATSTQREVRMGVELDSWGRPVGFHVKDRPLGHDFSYGGRREPYFVPAFDPLTGTGEMLHAFSVERASQARGISWFAPVLENSETRLKFEEFALVAAAKGAAQPTVLEATDAATPDLMAAELSAKKEATEDGEMVPERPTLPLDPETIPALPPGWKLAGVDSNYPNAIFGAFMTTYLRSFASGLGWDYESLCNDRAGASYSSNKMGDLSVRRLVEVLQNEEVDSLLTPVSLAWLRAALTRGMATEGREGLSLPDGAPADWRALARATYDPPVREWPEPLKEAQTAALEIACGISSRTEIAARRGKRFADVAAQLAFETSTADQLGITITPPGSVATDAAATAAEEEAGDTAHTNGNGNGAKAHAETVPHTARRSARLFTR